MTEPGLQEWIAGNQKYLVARLASVRAALERHASGAEAGAQVSILPAMPSPPALQRLSTALGLSPFESDVLLLAAGMEFDAEFPALCARAHGSAQRAYPTFGLALAALGEPHWSAVTPVGPLRYWKCIEIHPHDSVTAGVLRIDERILHYLAGVSYLDDRLQNAVEVPPPARELVPTHRASVDRILQQWSQSDFPLIELSGSDVSSKRSVAAQACAQAGFRLYSLKSSDVPEGFTAREMLARLWHRESLLDRNALLIDCHGADQPRAALALAEQMRIALFIASEQPLPLSRLDVARVDVHRPTAVEQRDLWHARLGPAFNGSAELLVSQFDLDSGAIEAASAQGLAEAPADQEVLVASVWSACRTRARGGLDELAQRLEPSADWNDLVLPAAQIDALHDIAAHVRCRAQVYNAWGFATKGTRGLGVSALFAGASGTGKTMAAEVLARELRLDLYRIDLSQVVSKFIGETEKNLRRVFDAAEASGAVLLFDEADALFGKRTEVKDSHDRYANIEVSYLLQRMESYRGLAVLTTNMKSMLDTAFLRRLRFVVQFPTPDSAQRAEIWRRVFPSNLPRDGIEVTKLARLNVSGGNIRNIALHAAFVAAHSKEPLRMTHLLRAARSEYAKLDRQLTDSECRDWV